MKKSIFIITAVFLCISVFSETYNFEDKSRILFEEAVTHYKNKDLYSSKEVFKQIISEIPDSDFARQSYFYLGKINNELSDELKQESIEYFSKTSLIYSKNEVGLEALLKNAELYRETGNVEELGRVYNKIIAEFPTHYKTENIYFKFFDYLGSFEEKEELFFKYTENFNESLQAEVFYAKMFEQYVYTGEIKKAENIFDYIKKQDVSEEVLELYYSNIRDYEKLYDVIKDNNKKVLEFNQRLYNINDIEESYEKLISENKDPGILFGFIDFLIANRKYEKASDIIKNNMYSVSEEQKPAFMLKAGVLKNKEKYYMSEDGKTYVKDVNDIIQAKQQFEKILVEYKDSEVIPQTLYEIILIEKDHLFNWKNLSEKAKLLIREYPDTTQAKEAEEILKKYRL